MIPHVSIWLAWRGLIVQTHLSCKVHIIHAGCVLHYRASSGSIERPMPQRPPAPDIAVVNIMVKPWSKPRPWSLCRSHGHGHGHGHGHSRGHESEHGPADAVQSGLCQCPSWNMGASSPAVIEVGMPTVEMAMLRVGMAMRAHVFNGSCHGPFWPCGYAERKAAPPVKGTFVFPPRAVPVNTFLSRAWLGLPCGFASSAV